MDELNAAFEVLVQQAINDAQGDTSAAFDHILGRLKREAGYYELAPAEEVGPIYDYDTPYGDNNCGEYDQHWFFIPARPPLPDNWGTCTNMYYDTDREEIRHFSYMEATIQ